MSRRKCDLHGERISGKLASCYWAWFLADGKRVAWRQLLCSPCLSEHFAAILRNTSSASMDVNTCPGCGGSSESDLDLVYLSLYLPKQVERTYELNTDAACAAKIRGSIVDHAERLPDRSSETRGPSPDDEDPWSDLEL
jgi:hypothetical protein